MVVAAMASECTARRVLSPDDSSDRTLFTPSPTLLRNHDFCMAPGVVDICIDVRRSGSCADGGGKGMGS